MSRWGLLALITAGLAGAGALTVRALGRADDPPGAAPMWDAGLVAAMQVPLALGPTPRPVSSELYYRVPARRLYRSYPVYHPQREPAGYLAWLRAQPPEEMPEPAAEASKQQLRQAGRLVFEAPILFDVPHDGLAEVRDPDWYRRTGMPVTGDGVLPFYRYVVTRPGQVAVGSHACAMCHSRVLEDGRLLEGGQGNYPFEAVYAYVVRRTAEREPPDAARSRVLAGERLRYATPWLEKDPMAAVFDMSLAQIADLHAAIPAGVMSRSNTSPLCPVQIPDLFGLAGRRYLDHTGLFEHRSPGDLMRYAAMVQGAWAWSSWGPTGPATRQPDPVTQNRYSDRQLQALAHYLYSLASPPGPSALDARQTWGRQLFEREGCGDCHSGPHYASSELIAVDGFTPSAAERARRAVSRRRVGTDPCLALYTRKGTGYYRVPSLRAVRYRAPLGHSGAASSLEEWFDPARLARSYRPRGFAGPRGPGGIPGHRFGLDLSAEERGALIAFLGTL